MAILGGPTLRRLAVCIMGLAMVSTAAAHNVTTDDWDNATAAMNDTTTQAVPLGSTYPFEEQYERVVEFCVNLLIDTCNVTNSSATNCSDEYRTCACLEHCPSEFYDSDVWWIYVQVYFINAYGAVPDHPLVPLYLSRSIRTLGCFRDRKHDELNLTVKEYIVWGLRNPYTLDPELREVISHCATHRANEIEGQSAFPVVLTLSIGSLIIGSIGNLLVILTVFVFVAKSSTTNLLIANIAISDFLMLVITQPMQIKSFKLDSIADGVFKGNEFMCRFYRLSEISAYSLSIILSLLMALDRYIVIIHPMMAKSLLTPGRVRLTIIVCWVLSFLLAVPDTAVMHGSSCEIFFGTPESIAITMYHLVGIYFIPVIITGFLYGRVIKVLIASIDTARSMTSGQDESNESAQSRIRVVRMLLISFLSLVLMWGPRFAFNFGLEFWMIPIRLSPELVGGFFSIERLQQTLMQISLFSGCVNPILYFIFSSQFRQCYLRILTCRPPERKDPTAMSTSTISSTISQTNVTTGYKA